MTQNRDLHAVSTVGLLVHFYLGFGIDLPNFDPERFQYFANYLSALKILKDQLHKRLLHDHLSIAIVSQSEPGQKSF